MITKEYVIDHSVFDRYDSMNMDQLLYFDIETTGLRGKSSNVVMIGYIYKKNNEWVLTQIFDDTGSDEQLLLSTFYNTAITKSVCVHYNGIQFDVPFLKDRYSAHKLQHPFTNMNQVDLYKDALQYKRFYNIQHYRQKDMEIFFKLNREDQIDGEEFMNDYLHYLGLRSRNMTEDMRVLLDKLYLHNYDDVYNLVLIQQCLYQLKSLVNGPHTVLDAQLDDNNESLIISFKTQCALSYIINQEYPIYDSDDQMRMLQLRNDEHGIHLTIPIHNNQLKMFFTPFAEYYYLETEGYAIHKSVATYMPNSVKRKATKENCYQYITLNQDVIENKDGLVSLIKGYFAYIL